MAMMTQSSFLTQEHLDLYKAEFPEDDRLQALSLEELLDKTRGVTLNHIIKPQPGMEFDIAPVTMSSDSTITLAAPCALGVATVIFDAILLAIGAVALRARIVKPVVQELVTVSEFAASKIGSIITKMAAKNATKTDIAKGFAAILKEIKDSGLFKKIWNAFKNSLTWYYAVLYGVVVLATIATLVTTGGLAIVAEFVLLLTACAFLLIDIGTAAVACAMLVEDLLSHEPPAVPAPNTDPYVTEPHGGLVTSDGYFLTFTNGGGLVAEGSALNTNATAITATEKFTLYSVDADTYSFAIRTSNGQSFVTAVNGGGLTNTGSIDWPIQSPGKSLGPTETIGMVQQEDGTFAFCMPNGCYLSAANGGGVSGSGGVDTNATSVSAYETFTFQRVPPPPKAS